ncbi:hypothetical protein [Rhizobiales bacterium 3FA27D7]|jgi:hypothetical protein
MRLTVVMRNARFGINGVKRRLDFEMKSGLGNIQQQPRQIDSVHEHLLR